MGASDELVLKLETRMQLVEDLGRQCSADIRELKNLVEANNLSIQEFVELAKALKLALKVAGYVEVTAVWIAKVSAAFAIIYAGWKLAVKDALSWVIK